MKIYALLLLPIACIGGEKKISVTNNIHVSQNAIPEPPPPPRSPKWQGSFPTPHPDVERLHREQEEQDAVTCCCFFKIKKRI